MMMVMRNCFCGMIDRRKAFSLISSRAHCQRPSPSRISDTPRVEFDPAQKLSSSFVEWSCTVVITTTPRHHIKSLCSALILPTVLFKSYDQSLTNLLSFVICVNPIHDGEEQKKTNPLQFFPCNFYRRRNQPPKLSDFQFSCYTCVKFQGHT